MSAGGRLRGKVALISGTGRGVGRAAALVFAGEGARVAGCDIDEEGQAGTARLVEEAGGEMLSTAPVDLATEAGAKKWVELAVAEFGTIDIVYNNAAAVRLGTFSEVTAEDWYFTVRNELDIVHFVTAAAWPHLVAGGGGAIINTSSVSAIRGVTARFAEQAAHGATKGGILSYTYHLAASGGPHGIRANAILPGLIRTPETEPLFEQEDHPAAELARQPPSGRYAEPEEIAKVALFLASEDAAHVNAAEIRIDGGQSMMLI